MDKELLKQREGEQDQLLTRAEEILAADGFDGHVLYEALHFMTKFIEHIDTTSTAFLLSLVVGGRGGVAHESKTVQDVCWRFACEEMDKRVPPRRFRRDFEESHGESEPEDEEGDVDVAADVPVSDGEGRTQPAG